MEEGKKISRDSIEVNKKELTEPKKHTQKKEENLLCKRVKVNKTD